MKANTVMTVDVATVAPDVRLKRARQKMQELGVRHLPVVVKGKLAGIVSDRDLLTRSTRKHGRLQFPDLPVSEVMSRVTLTRGPKATVSELAHLMIDEKIDAVPIIEPDRTLVGLVTTTDLLMLLTDFMRPQDRLPFSFSLRHAED